MRLWRVSASPYRTVFVRDGLSWTKAFYTSDDDQWNRFLAVGRGCPAIEEQISCYVFFFLDDDHLIIPISCIEFCLFFLFQVLR